MNYMVSYFIASGLEARRPETHTEAELKLSKEHLKVGMYGAIHQLLDGTHIVVYRDFSIAVWTPKEG